jgi:hypothetical protein
MSVRGLFTFEQRGAGYSIHCKSCGAAITEHFDYGKGFGIIGYSGHKDDCDYILAGLTVDLNKQDDADERAAYDAATPAERELYDIFKEDERKAMSTPCGSEGYPDIAKAYLCGFFSRYFIHYKPRERQHI